MNEIPLTIFQNIVIASNCIFIFIKEQRFFQNIAIASNCFFVFIKE